MYSVVLMMAMSTNGVDATALGRRGGGGCCGCHGGGYAGSCYGGGYGGRGGCYGGRGGCYGGGYGGMCYGGGYGGMSYGGCYGGGWGGGYGGGFGGCTGGIGYSGMGYGGCSGSGWGYGGCYGGGYGGMPYGGGYGGMPGGWGIGGGGWGYSGGGGMPYVPFFSMESGTPVTTPVANVNTATPNTATLVVELPADAKLTIDGKPTTSTGAVRTFRSPPLANDRDYYYNLKGEMMRDGQMVSVTKKVRVRPGQENRVALDFADATAAASR